MRLLLALAIFIGGLSAWQPDANAARKKFRGAYGYYPSAPLRSYRRSNGVCEERARFFDPNGGRIDVQVEFEDGVPRVRVRDRRLEDGRHGGSGSSGRGGDDSPTVTTAPAPPTRPTVDDHGGRTDRDDRVEPGDDRDDDSGHGGDDDRDDRSGRGGGDDRDDDNSGHGSDD